MFEVFTKGVLSIMWRGWGGEQNFPMSCLTFSSCDRDSKWSISMSGARGDSPERPLRNGTTQSQNRFE